MGFIARAQLASAVSNAGGLGIIETSSGQLDDVRGEIQKMRALTDKPFGVNIAQLFVRDPSIVDFVAENGVTFVTTSAGDPTKYTAILKDAGLTVFHVVPSLRGALKAVGAGVDRLQCPAQRRHDMEHRDAGILERTRELGRIPGRRRDEAHVMLGHEVDDRGVADEELGDVDAERLVGEIAHLGDLDLHLVEPAGRRLDDAEPARVRYGRRELGPRDEPHRRLHDRVLDSQHLRDPSPHGLAS